MLTLKLLSLVLLLFLLFPFVAGIGSPVMMQFSHVCSSVEGQLANLNADTGGHPFFLCLRRGGDTPPITDLKSNIFSLIAFLSTLAFLTSVMSP